MPTRTILTSSNFDSPNPTAVNIICQESQPISICTDSKEDLTWVEFMLNETEGTETDELLDFFSEFHTTQDTTLNTQTDKKITKGPLGEGPHIPFISKPSWLSFIERLENEARENRLLDIAKRIEKAGGCMRQLQTLDPHWPQQIDLFEELFPNFGAVADLLRDYFSLQSVGDNRIYFPALLLVGEAGIGKTEAARWLANNLAVPFCLIDMASAQTGSALSGSERFWTNTRVGQVFETLAYEAYANPIIMLDELDKALGDSKFDPFAPLYTLLEQSAAKTFTDLSIGDFSVNASHINWIATANTIDSIPQPIRSRLTVIDIKKPTVEQAKSITKNIYARLLAESSWGNFFDLQLDEVVINSLIAFPPRIVKIVLTRALGSAIRKVRNYVSLEDLSLPKGTQSNGIGFLAIQNT